MPKSWSVRLKDCINQLTHNNRILVSFAEANANSICEAIGNGKEPCKAKAVVNIAAKHVPSFCEKSKASSPAYLNCYDLKTKTARLGSETPDSSWKGREIVDHALLDLHGKKMENIYFMATEINGAGISFYGDVCLVLKELPGDTTILDRNSYDLTREPFASEIKNVGAPNAEHERRKDKAKELAGKWGENLGEIAAIKVLTATGGRARRLTTGQISAGILEDEDYIEILKHGSFSTNDLECARLSAPDVALEGHITRKRGSSTSPSVSELTWLHQRQEALRALEDAKVPVTVVTTLGRTKG